MGVLSLNGRSVLERRSNDGQTLVKRWSNAGQTLGAGNAVAVAPFAGDRASFYRDALLQRFGILFREKGCLLQGMEAFYRDRRPSTVIGDLFTEIARIE